MEKNYLIYDCQYFSTTVPPPSKPTKVNPTTIPTPNRLCAYQMMSMRVRVASYGSNEQDIAVLAPVGNT